MISTAVLALAQRGAYADALRGYLAPAGSPWLSQISVRSVGRIERIAVDEILWLESAGNYVQLHTAGRTILYRVTLNKMETHLDPAHFSRVHRRAVVRLVQLHSLAVTDSSGFCNTSTFSIDNSRAGSKQAYAAALAAMLSGKKVRLEVDVCAGWSTMCR